MTETPAPAPLPPLEAGLDPKLLEILVCPVTHGPLEYDRTAGELISRAAKLAYPVRDGVPVMLPEEAREL
ncbi:MAG: Trm112 family protein [Phenylobacterium sp.]